MTKYEIIGRDFIKVRHDKEMIYEFRTRSFIFTYNEDEVLQKLYNHLVYCLIQGRTDMPKGCSNCDELAGLNYKQAESEVINICRESGFLGKGNKMHPITQNHFMNTDDKSVAIEIPVWNEEAQRTGFIDLIRYVDGILWILDFKPNAHKERWQKVMSQLFWYKYMLCKQLDIPHDKVRCAYFDNLNFYELNHRNDGK